jgi:hypothetical protein
MENMDFAKIEDNLRKKLKSCPFCKSSEIEFVEDVPEIGSNRSIYSHIRCWNCKCQGPLHDLKFQDIKEEKKMVKEWNKIRR